MTFINTRRYVQGCSLRALLVTDEKQTSTNGDRANELKPVHITENTAI